jgi:hypothetical protein
MRAEEEMKERWPARFCRAIVETACEDRSPEAARTRERQNPTGHLPVRWSVHDAS